MTDRFSVLLIALRRPNWRQDAVVVAAVVAQQQLVVVTEHLVLFHDRFEEKSVGESVQQIEDEFAP